MLWVLHTRCLTHRRAWKSSSLVFTLPQDRCCFILRKSSSKLVAAKSPQLETIVRWITSSGGTCNSVSACYTSYLWSMQLWNMVWQSASSGGACKRQCMLQYGVHKLGLLCNKLFPPEVPAQCQCKSSFVSLAHKTLNYHGIKYFLRGCLQLSVHGVVHMCALFKPVHLNSYRLVTAVTSTCCSFPGDWLNRSGKILLQLFKVTFKSTACPLTELSSAPVSSAATPINL